MKFFVRSAITMVFFAYYLTEVKGVADALATLNAVVTRIPEKAKAAALQVLGSGPTSTSTSSSRNRVRLTSRIQTIYPPTKPAPNTNTKKSRRPELNVDVANEKKNKNDTPATTEKRLLLPISNRAAIGMGMILAFNSGVINSACLSGFLAEGTKQGTAAITGAWTNSALGAASMVSSSSTVTATAAAAAAGAHQFAFNAKCILSYMAGSVVSGLIIPRPKAFELDVKKSLSLFGIASGLLATATLLADASNINYLFFCCLANGIQNSFTSTLTANMCRTTHFTGITSDMGTFLGQVLRGNTQNLSRLKTNLMLAASFWIGGFLSFGLTRSYGSVVLFGSAMVHLAFVVYLGLKHKQYHRRLPSSNSNSINNYYNSKTA